MSLNSVDVQKMCVMYSLIAAKEVWLVRVEGMKAANQVTPEYTEDHFISAANEIEALAENLSTLAFS